MGIAEHTRQFGKKYVRIHDKEKDDMKTQKVLFARIGWMKFYSGSQEGDEKPIGGGKWNKKRIGGEIFNFLKLDGKYYGYLMPHARRHDNDVKISLERICPHGINCAGKGDHLDHVLVIFVAKSKDLGQVIVGWYKDATVYRGWLEKHRKLPGYVKAHWYNLVADSSSCVLLPTNKRSHPIPSHRSKSMGQANAFYLYESNGEPKCLNNRGHEWITRAIEYVNSYKGENLVDNPDAEITAELEEIYDRNMRFRLGQGFDITPVLRKKIEDYSVGKAKRYFEKQGFKVKDVGNIRPYDLECERRNRKLAVEVKGTTTEGKTILLTKNEVENAEKRPTALFVLHSIRVTKKRRECNVSGGIQQVIMAWKPHRHNLVPMTFNYYLK